MSGICGIVALDGGKPDQSDLAAMLTKLEKRGPDGSHQWHSGRAALGHTLLATTPEALVEFLPLTDAATGCTITADCRLDNREELIAALDLSDAVRVIGDGELILRAYIRWGEECPTKLLGDFAFAIWDPREQTLFCARDHMGMRQLIYHHRPGKLFAFATEAQAVLASRSIERRINDERIADFLDDLEGIDLRSTFFSGVLRLPPAHALTVDARKLDLRRYWRLEPPPELILDSDDSYAEAFRDVFTSAVRCRLRSVRLLGATVSGGIDSNSVAAIAAQLLAEAGQARLQTFSAIDDQEGCTESKAIRSAIANPAFESRLVNVSEIDGLSDELVRLADSQAEPFDGHMTMIRALYLRAHQAGVRIMLDGAAGDVVLTSSNRLALLLRQGRVGTALRDAVGAQRFWKARGHAARELLAGAWVAFVPESIRAPVRKVKWSMKDRASRSKRVILPQFARTIGLKSRRLEYRSHLPAAGLSNAEKRAKTISHPNLVTGRERYDRVAAAMAIEPRDPFVDIRLIRFCLSLPDEMLQRDGLPKWILRRAVAGLVPGEVVWKSGKEHLGWTFTQRLFAARNARTDGLRLDSTALQPFVSLQSAKNLRPQASEIDEAKLVELHSLAVWLAANAKPTQ